ncbi:ABC transporter permease, partial [Photobacterium aphoticum]
MTELSTPAATPPTVYRGLLTKWSWRELWQGQLWPVAVALTLIIACVFALSALVMRVEGVMVDQGRSMIAADRVFRSANPLPPTLLERAEQQGLQTSVQTRFGTMAFSDEAMQLVSVKSVDSAFPLRGALSLQSANGVRHQVQPGELWLAARLFDLLKVKEGDTLAIGDAELVISGTIMEEPELSFNPFSQMPAVLIHADDLAQTGAIQPGSRVQYRAYFKGEDAQLAALQQATTLAAGDRWLSETTQGRTGDILEKARQYLSLTLILVIMMATATLVLTCLHYVSTRRETVAMMKSLGASRRWLWLWLSRQLVMLFTLAALAGGAIGSGLEYLLRLPLGAILPDALPSVGLMPWGVSVLVALLVALPAMGIALWQLVEAPAIAVMQPQVDVPLNPERYLLLLFPVLAALWWFGDNGLMWVTLAGLFILMGVLGLLGVLVVAVLKRFRWGAAMQLALSRISRSPL